MREVSLDILDILQNSADAGAKRIELELSIENGNISFKVADDAGGIADIERALQKGVSFKGSSGLGLSTVKENCESAGGKFEIDSSEKGTSVFATYKTAKLGDLGETYLAAASDKYLLEVKITANGNIATFDTAEFISALGTDYLKALGVLRKGKTDINKFIRKNQGEIAL